jgi:hypothetical protein
MLDAYSPSVVMLDTYSPSVVMTPPRSALMRPMAVVPVTPVSATVLLLDGVTVPIKVDALTPVSDARPACEVPMLPTALVAATPNATTEGDEEGALIAPVAATPDSATTTPPLATVPVAPVPASPVSGDVGVAVSDPMAAAA